MVRERRAGAFGGKRPLSGVGLRDERGEQRGVWCFAENTIIFVFMEHP
jgi:hypothetical protein